jgi:hypothetical protein
MIEPEIAFADLENCGTSRIFIYFTAVLAECADDMASLRSTSNPTQEAL